MATFFPSITVGNLRQGFALVVPAALVASMPLVFQFLSQRFEHTFGYFLGFIFYWLVWCTLVPLLLLGGVKPLLSLFQPFPPFSALGWQTHLALWLPVAFPLFYIFIPRVANAAPSVLLASLILGVVIGLTEEVLWRGVYMRLFPANVWLNLVYPSVMFALWHIAPQTVVVNRQPGGVISFVVYAFILGLAYAFSVHQTKSIAWCTIAHILHDSLGLGGFAYISWLVGK